jgi:hypothetical protein
LLSAIVGVAVGGIHHGSSVGKVKQASQFYLMLVGGILSICCKLAPCGRMNSGEFLYRLTEIVWGLDQKVDAIFE